MNNTTFKLKYYKDTNFTYIGIDKHTNDEVGGWDTTIRKTQYEKLFYNQQSSMSEVDYSAYSRSREAVENKHTGQQRTAVEAERTQSTPIVQPQPARSAAPSSPTSSVAPNKAEFQALWNEINHQYVYQVSYDSNELIDKAILYINKDLEVKQLRYVMVEGTQDESQVTEFGNTRSQSRELTDVCTSTVKYDLVGDIAQGANLTRRTVVKILQGIKQSKLYLFKNNPEEFIRKVISIIKEQKSTMIVEDIHYNITEGKYDSDIFTVKSKMDFDRAYEAKKHITDYVFSDSKGERQFAHDLDEASEVVVYAKLPRTFQIPTPVGNYAPDWAIAMKKNDVKHIFFVAETKGSMSSMDLSAIERAKIDCAEKLFNSISTANVKYHKVATYQDLIDGMNAIG